MVYYRSGDKMTKRKDENKADTSILLTIGAMSKALGVNQVTLRAYDKGGFLVPRRTDTNRRGYTLEDVDRGKIILFVTRNLLLDLNAVKIFNLIFKEKKIQDPKEQLEYLNSFALKAGFSKEIQQKNIEKWHNRGTNKKTDNN